MNGYTRYWNVERVGDDRLHSHVTLTEWSHGFCEHVPLWESLEHRDHSPTGFEFGYAGSGPSQLALAIMLRFFRGTEEPVKDALATYQNFKFAFLAGQRGRAFTVAESEIAAWVRAGALLDAKVETKLAVDDLRNLATRDDVTPDRLRSWSKTAMDRGREAVGLEEWEAAAMHFALAADLINRSIRVTS